MSYKKTKKTKKISRKQKRGGRTHLIPDEFIKGKCFAEIINKASESSELTNRDRYIYGYSLLKTQQNLKALVNLWPLAAKGNVKLQEDCAVIAAHVFANKDFLFSIDLSTDEIYTLFWIGKNLIPQSSIYHSLKRRLFDSLWQQQHFEKLERILKSSREKFSGILVENLSKLDFLQPRRKLVGNIPAFIGHILTGGACLIIQNPLYHDDITNEIRLLADEIKSLFYSLKTKNQLLAWDKTLFENFVDYEANILIHILQTVVKNIKEREENFDIIPTPSYLMHYDSTTKRVSEKFLSWFASENKELFEAYNTNTHSAVLWAIGGEKTTHIDKILKSTHKDKINPYLRLAIMLRSVNMKKTPLEKLVQLSDFVEFKQTSGVFKKIAIQTVKSMANKHHHTQLPKSFWEILFEFYPVLQDPDCRNILILQLIEKLEEEYAEQLNLDFVKLKNTAYQIDAHDLAKQAETLCARQKECANLLLDLKDKKKSKKIVENVKDESTLRKHLTLIADCCLLTYPKLSLRFFQHIESIVQHKEINKLISLREFFYCAFDCACISCQEILYIDEIPTIAKKLNLPISNIPKIKHYAHIQPPSKTQKSKSSILSQDDPFKILDVSLSDSKQVIMQKVMRLIQQSPGQMATYRQAQNELFNPTRRFLHQYLRYLNYQDSSVENSAQKILSTNKTPLHKIPLRNEFL